MHLPTLSIRRGLKALTATQLGKVTLGAGVGPGVGFISHASMFSFPRSSYVDGFYYTMQNASYAYIWQSQPNVPTVVGYLGNQFSQIPMVLSEIEDDGTYGDPVYDHPAAESCRWPAPHIGGSEWREKMCLDFLVYSNAYSVIIKPTGARTATLIHIPAFSVGVGGENRLVPTKYRILFADGTSQDIPPEEMIHWRGSNLADPRVGWSKMEQLRQILIEEATRAATNIEFNRAGRIRAGIVKRPLEAPEWSDQARERFETDLSGRMRGATEGRSPVFEEGMDWVDIGVTPREAEIVDATKLTLAQVCNIYGLHDALFRPNPGNTDLSDARRQVFEDALPPLLMRFAETLNLRLLRGTFSEKGMAFSFDWSAKLDGEEDRIQKLVGAAGRPIYTLNEARKRAGLGPVPGGDEVVLMTNVVQVDEHGNAIPTTAVAGAGGKPSTNVQPIPNPNTPAEDGSHRQGAPPAAKAFDDLKRRLDSAIERGDREDIDALTFQLGRVQVQQVKAQLAASTNGTGVLSEPVLVQRRAAVRARKEGYATDMEKAVRRHFGRQRKAMENGSAVRANTKRWNEELATDIRKAMTDHVQHEGDVVAARLMGTFEMSRVTDYIQAGSVAMAVGINVTTQNKLDEARDGKSMLVSRDDAIAQVFDNAVNVRAVELGKTHATHMAGFAGYEAARQNPGEGATIRIKEWIPSDLSATARHAHLAGQSVMVEAAFTNGMMYPGDPTAETDQTANCGCDLDVY